MNKWLIADMYYPSESLPGAVHSHEAISVLNASDVDAAVNITLYFEDREPIVLEEYVVKARRTWHIRMDLAKTRDGASVPMDTGYAAVVESKADLAVQYTRVDARQTALALMSTMVGKL